MKIPDLRGLKFPDEYVIKFFFKEGLDRISGDVVEFGCGNGNNLILFYQYGWNVTGLDINGESLENAQHNFTKISTNNKFRFIQQDIAKGIYNVLDRQFDAILLPNIIYYIPRRSVNLLLSQVANLIKSGTKIFLRTRGIKDYRYGRGRIVERNGFILEVEETGEFGSLNVFYYEYELIDLLRNHLGLAESSIQVFTVESVNLQKGVPIYNADIVIWGRCEIA
jgi:SAM-dependent methyltransferase